MTFMRKWGRAHVIKFSDYFIVYIENLTEKINVNVKYIFKTFTFFLEKNK